jgi:hypothetical protein
VLHVSSPIRSYILLVLFSLIVTRTNEMMRSKEQHSAAAAAAGAITEDYASLRGVLLKRKDFLGLDEHALAHPNRTYYYR